MVARDDKQALPKAALPAAPTLLDCFLEALKKREGCDHRLQVPINPSADQSPATPKPLPAGRARASLPPLSK
jgi:hypothetical protein